MTDDFSMKTRGFTSVVVTVCARVIMSLYFGKEGARERKSDYSRPRRLWEKVNNKRDRVRRAHASHRHFIAHGGWDNLGRITKACEWESERGFPQTDRFLPKFWQFCEMGERGGGGNRFANENLFSSWKAKGEEGSWSGEQQKWIFDKWKIDGTDSFMSRNFWRLPSHRITRDDLGIVVRKTSFR